MTTTSTPFFSGRYSLRSLARRVDDGSYRASLSITSGRGSTTTGRVVRFDERFGSDADAHAWARRAGLDWCASAAQPTGFTAPGA